MGEGYIVRRGGVGGNGWPEFTYEKGAYEWIDDEYGNWRIKFLSSGILRFTKLGNAKKGIEVFCVGGGGGGSNGDIVVIYGGGGGGGYTNTKTVLVQKDTDYEIVVGAGSANNSRKSGGMSSAFGVQAVGGDGGLNMTGGNGGSGGGGGTRVRYDTDDGTRAGYGGDGGSDGNNGSPGRDGWQGNNGAGGTGQGTTTREFGETEGELYAGGGAGRGYHGSGTAGAGGGGGPSQSATNNTGGGGGGSGGNGGSGIVVIRNARKKLKITQQPINVVASENEEVLFTVKAEGIKLNYQWQFLPTDTDAQWSNTSTTGATTNQLTVQALSYRNGYKYRCIVSDGYNNQVISDEATLTISA